MNARASAELDLLLAFRDTRNALARAMRAVKSRENKRLSNALKDINEANNAANMALGELRNSIQKSRCG